MSLAQDIRNAYEWRDRAALERALAKIPNVTVSFAAALDPELACSVCGVAQKKHGTYPTCASHHFTAPTSSKSRCGNMHCGGKRANGECGLSSPGVVFMGHCQGADLNYQADPPVDHHSV